MRQIFIFFLISLIIISNKKSSAIDDLKNPSKLEILFDSEVQKLENRFYIGIQISLEEGWKTYWKNPGDSGASLTLDWKYEQKENINYEVLYPAPSRFVDLEIETIGYEDKVIFPIEIKFIDEIQPKEIDVDINYLVCKHICIPITESGTIRYDSQNINKKNNGNLKKILSGLPLNQNKVFQIVKTQQISNREYLVEFESKKNLFEKFEFFTFSKNYTFNENIQAVNGNFKLSLISDIDLGSSSEQLDIVIKNGDIAEEKKILVGGNFNKKNILLMIIFAFVGGIILNFMPCVLPILSLKIYHLIRIREKNPSDVFKLSFSTILGIMVSFFILAIFTIILKSLGHDIGWGMQFQNKTFLFIFSIMLILFSANLLGLFEIMLPNKVNQFLRISDKNKFFHSFMSGVLATVFATPCSAPFLGTSIGYALMQNNFTILIIFLTLSVGFSFPYILLLIFPKIIRIFPSPGRWMVYLGPILGLLLLISGLWLLQLININTNSLILLGLLVICISIYFNKNLGREKFSVLFIQLSLFIFIVYFGGKVNDEELSWNSFNNNDLERSIKNNEVIFVDITADWCITCQINKLTTLNSSEIQSYFNNEKIKLIRGDWTNRNEEILSYISKYGKFGIPFNIIYGPLNKDGVVLSELLTNDEIIKTLQSVR